MEVKYGYAVYRPESCCVITLTKPKWYWRALGLIADIYFTMPVYFIVNIFIAVKILKVLI